MYAGPLLLNNMYSELLVNSLLASVNSLGRILRCEFVKFVTENIPRYSKKHIKWFLVHLCLVFVCEVH